jgi:hypothetical protein
MAEASISAHWGDLQHWAVNPCTNVVTILFRDAMSRDVLLSSENLPTLMPDKLDDCLRSDIHHSYDARE